MIAAKSVLEYKSAYMAYRDEPGVYLGFSCLAPYKMVRDRLVIIGGRPKVGKSTLVLNMVERMLVQYPSHGDILYFSFEESPISILEDLFKMKVDEDIMRRLHVVEGLMTLREMHEAYARGNYFAMFIDYLDMIQLDKQDDKGSDYERTSLKVKKLKEFKQFGGSEKLAPVNCPVICLAQLSREAGSGGEAVNMTSFRGSGYIEASADLMFGVWRPELRPNISESELTRCKGQMVVKCLGNRFGKAGMHTLWFDEMTERYTEFRAMAGQENIHWSDREGE